MTKSTGVGRGGPRPNAGRKPDKPTSARFDVPVATIKASVSDVTELAKTHTQLAVQVLAEIAANGDKDAARVAAANALLDRAHGKSGAVADGKKERRQAKAEEAAGKFAPRARPAIVVNNG